MFIVKPSDLSVHSPLVSVKLILPNLGEAKLDNMTNQVSQFDSLQEKYKKLCKYYQVDPVDEIIQQFKSLHAGNTVVNLSNFNLNVTMCKILGKMLAVDNSITELRFSDSLLPEEGIAYIAECLCKNFTVTTLDLKGNNISGKAAIAIGRLLTENHTIQRLYFEWNNLGVFPESFSAFVGGLAVNSSLQELDLRNNQISHIEATALAQALERNTSLRNLDLRWNNVGLLGSQSLLNTLGTNRTLQKIELSGNNIPSEIFKAIDIALKNNLEFNLMLEEHKKREVALKTGLRHVESQSSSQIENLRSQIKQQEDGFLQTQKLSSFQIGSLQEALDERKSAFQTLEAKLIMNQKTMALIVEEKDRLQEELVRVSQENTDLKTQHLNILHKEREEYAEKEHGLFVELRNCKDELKQCEMKISEYEKSFLIQQQKLSESQNEISRINESYNNKLSVLKDQMTNEEKQYQEKLQMLNKQLHDMEAMNSNYVLRLRETENEVKIFQKQQHSMQEELVKEAAQRKHEKAELEEHLKRQNLAKDKIELQLSHLQETNREWRMKHDVLQHELETQKKLCEQLNKVAESKENLEKELWRTREELNETKRRHEQQVIANQAAAKEHLQKELKRLENQLADQEKKFADQLGQKDLEISKLKDAIISKEEHWQRKFERDAHRAATLHTAIKAYLQGTGEPL